jgi:hypothetical protein
MEEGKSAHFFGVERRVFIGDFAMLTGEGA